jgi:hypothetical protein
MPITATLCLASDGQMKPQKTYATFLGRAK